MIMKQRAHAWVALRALKLIDDLAQKDTQKLVELLSYYVSDCWEGAWLPDTLIGDMSYGHIFKMDCDDNFVSNVSSSDYRRKSYQQLTEETMGTRLCLEDYLLDSEDLEKPYWIPEEGGGHLPDRVIAISHSIIDMLKMGDFPISFYLSKEKSKVYAKRLCEKKVKDLSQSPNFSARQVAIAFFLQSHYICDAHMPLHCDLRDVTAKKIGSEEKERRLPPSLHPGIENVWENYFPEKNQLTLHAYTPKSVDNVVTDLPSGSLIEIDKNPKYKLTTQLFKSMPNEWDEMVDICRISYGVARKLIPQTYTQIEESIGKKNCEKKAGIKYEDLVTIIDEDEFKDVTNRIFHDAVESVARLWYRAWYVFTK